MIRVSELSEYVYCARAWWLRRVAGEEPAGHARRKWGTLLHRRHGCLVRLSSMVFWLAGILVAAVPISADANTGLPPLFLLLAGLSFWLALALRRNTGIPWVRVVGSDTGGDHHHSLAQPLLARQIGLTGKPDYILEKGGVWFPVEVKPGRHATSPYESDVMQVAAYCLLLEETTGSPPPYGLLRYARTTFRVPYTPSVRERVLNVLEAMWADLTDDDDEPCARSHSNPARCRHCGFVAICEESLV